MRKRFKNMKICLIGNSFIGAPYKAYNDFPNKKSTTIDFIGAPGTDFLKLKIEDGLIKNVKFSSLKISPAVSDYDFFYVIGTLPGPYDLLMLEEELLASHYSSQFVNAYLKDRILSSKAISLARDLKSACSGKIFLIPSNVNLLRLPNNISFEKITQKENMIKECIADNASYLPAPKAFFDDSLLPIKSFYQGSLDIDGKPAGHHVNHDMLHMNQEGGKVLLECIYNNIIESSEI